MPVISLLIKLTETINILFTAIVSTKNIETYQQQNLKKPQNKPKKPAT